MHPKQVITSIASAGSGTNTGAHAIPQPTAVPKHTAKLAAQRLNPSIPIFPSNKIAVLSFETGL